MKDADAGREPCREGEGLRFTRAEGGGRRIRGEGRELEVGDIGEGDPGLWGVHLCWGVVLGVLRGDRAWSDKADEPETEQVAGGTCQLGRATTVSLRAGLLCHPPRQGLCLTEA